MNGQINMIGAAHPLYKVINTDWDKDIKYKPDNFIIGVSGYARAGKDTIGDYLAENHGFTKFAFADKLRETVHTLNPIVGIQSGAVPFVRWQDVINDYGYDNYKETDYGTEMRRLLQVMGTEVGREMISDTIWVDELNAAKGRVVVTDLRFPNEYNKIKTLGGMVWRVDRAGTKPVNPHKSETAIDDKTWDAHFHNDGTLGDLYMAVEMVLDEYGITGTVL